MRWTSGNEWLYEERVSSITARFLPCVRMIVGKGYSAPSEVRIISGASWDLWVPPRGQRQTRRDYAAYGRVFAWHDTRTERAELGYGARPTGEEVDFVIEAGGKLLPIEVKSAARSRLSDAAHLRPFRAE